MKRTTITIPDDLESRIEKYLQTSDAPPSLSAVVRAALAAYRARRDVHEPQRPIPTPVQVPQSDGLGARDTEMNRHSDRLEESTGDLPRPRLFEEMTQEDLDRLPRVLTITPTEKEVASPT